MFERQRNKRKKIEEIGAKEISGSTGCGAKQGNMLRKRNKSSPAPLKLPGSTTSAATVQGNGTLQQNIQNPRVKEALNQSQKEEERMCAKKKHSRLAARSSFLSAPRWLSS